MKDDKMKAVAVALLEKEDCINLICGISENYRTMEVLHKMGLGHSYSYCDKTGYFKWNRHSFEIMEKDELIDIYKELKETGQKEDHEAKAEVQTQSFSKRCYFKCMQCGYDKVAKEDKYCAECGRLLIFDVE